MPLTLKKARLVNEKTQQEMADALGVYIDTYRKMEERPERVHNAGDLRLIPGSGRFPGVGHGHPLQYSCLGNSMDRGAWRATVHGVAKSQTRLSD